MTTSTLNPTADTFIYAGAATTNYGSNGNLYSGHPGSGGAYRSLLQFNIPSVANAVVSSAKLRLYATSDDSSNVRTKRVYRVKRAMVLSEATWNVYSTGNSWETAGGFGSNDCEQTDIGSLSFSASETLNEYKEITLTNAAIQAIMRGTWTNKGFMVKTDTENTDRYGFNSVDAASNKPELVIVYTLEGRTFQVITF
jgi:hypothetical protein